MARVEVSAAAVEDLDDLIATRRLPPDTGRRVARSLRALERFPEIGPELAGRWAGLRFVLGPWRWMVVVYAVLDNGERVVVATIQDARAASAVTGER